MNAAETEVRPGRNWQRPLALWLSVGWLLIAGFTLIIDYLSVSFQPGWLLRIYLSVTILASFVSFGAYWLDKRRANQERPRVSERRLHIFALVGGWPGALLGQQMFRHKTLKVPFRIVLWGIIGLHLTVFGWFLYVTAFPNTGTNPGEAAQPQLVRQVFAGR